MRLAVCAALMLLPVPLSAAVKWQEGVLEVTGSGAAVAGASSVQEARTGAERAAHAEVFQKAFAEVAGLAMTASQTVGALMATSPELRGRVEQLLRQYKVVETRYFADGGVELIAQIPLGVLAAALLPGPPQPAATPLLVANTGALLPSSTATDLGPAPTGIIIDARGKGVRPGLGLRILDPEGRVVFDARQVRPDVLRREGACLYTTSLEQAKRHVRAGDRPLLFVATGAQGTNAVDVVVDVAAATRLSNIDEDLWTQARLVLVMDES